METTETLIIPTRSMTLNRNVDNFFAETEQVAFHPGHLVPGIDFTNDPLLQGRLFSYTDTQLSRLGSPNFHEIPINRSVNPIYMPRYSCFHLLCGYYRHFTVYDRQKHFYSYVKV